MIELLITVLLAGLVLGPIVGVGLLVMKRYRPTVQSAQASKQLRLFRTVLADDWASAAQIVVDPPDVWYSYISCNGQGYTAAPKKIRIAMATSYKVGSYQLRIVYREIPNADGTIRVDRVVCRHNLDPNLPGVWATGGRDTDGPVYRNDPQLKQVRAFVLPTGTGCNTTAEPPFQPCDMNVTVIGVDGDRVTPFNPGSPYASSAQRTTIRLHQQVGPIS